MKGRFWVFVLFVAVWGLFSIVLPTKGSFAADPVKIDVYDPTGAIEVTQLFAPRLSDLHGKTICELSNDTWEATRSLAAIRELLQRQYPTAKIIPYTEFPQGTEKIDVDKIGDLAKQKGCQAAIVGNAG